MGAMLGSGAGELTEKACFVRFVAPVHECVRWGVVR